MYFNEILKKDKKYRYQLLSRMKSDCDYYLGNGGRYAGHLWGKDEIKHIAYMKALWNSFSDNDKPEWLTREELLDYEQKIGVKAVLVEMDYKGYYERFALTPEEFKEEFPETYEHFGPIEESNSDTLKPFVHIWFNPCVVGDASWHNFFTDMEAGLPESDIESGNLAYIDDNQFQSLKKYMQTEQRFYVHNTEFGTAGYGLIISEGLKSYNDALDWVGENRPELKEFEILNDFKIVGPKDFVSSEQKPSLDNQLNNYSAEQQKVAAANKHNKNNIER